MGFSCDKNRKLPLLPLLVNNGGHSMDAVDTVFSRLSADFGKSLVEIGTNSYQLAPMVGSQCDGPERVVQSCLILFFFD